MVDEKKIIKNLIKSKEDNTKYDILRHINKGKNSFDDLKKLGYSKPLLSFHINGTAKNRLNGLFGLGFINKLGVDGRYDKFYYTLTDEGKYIIELLKGEI